MVAWARWILPMLLLLPGAWRADGAADAIRARNGMVVSQSDAATRVGVEVLRDGGHAVDAAVATAFALAVTHPAAGNLGGGGFLIYRAAEGEAVAYDFREAAPARAHARMFLRDGEYDSERHHRSHLAIGVPGTVAGLHLAWGDHGALPWARLVEPAIGLAREGFVVSESLARSLEHAWPKLTNCPAALAQFSKNGVPYAPGERLEQPDLARTLSLIAKHGPAGFYQGTVAAQIEEEMVIHGGLITRADLEAYQAKRRVPLRSRYRGFEVISMPPPSSGGTVLLQMLNLLEGFDLAETGFGSALTVHRMAEAMRRGFAARARYLADPDFVPDQPIDRLISKEHAASLRGTILARKASVSASDQFEWPVESAETTHLSVVDAGRNAVALTYTLEESYGSGIIAAGTGFLLNNEMGDFNAGPGLTTTNGLIGTPPNLAAPGKRMLSSMTPTIMARNGRPFLVLGSPGGRTMINTVLETIVNVVDHGMNLQQAVDVPRFHHQWLPDEIVYERQGLSPDTVSQLRGWGHRLRESESAQGVVTAVFLDPATNELEGAADRRAPDALAAGW